MSLRLYSVLFNVKAGQERVNLAAHDAIDAIHLANCKMSFRGYTKYSLADIDALFEPLEEQEVKPS